MAILTYHHIGHPPPEQRDHLGLWVSPGLFRQQLGWLRDHGYEGVTLDQVSAALGGGRAEPLPRRWACITFDDGWRDNLTEGAPALEELGLCATIFLISSRLRAEGAPAAGAWDEYLSVDEARGLAARRVGGRPLVELGSHSMTHPRLARLGDDEARAELAGSREALAGLLGEAPRHLAYPYGSFSRRTAALAAEAGYDTACATIRDNRPTAAQRYWLPRVMVMGDTSPGRLGYMLSPWYHYVHAWKNRRRWRTLREG